MKTTIAVAALVSSSSAIKQKASPDVYGPNGTDYSNTDGAYDLSRIGIDMHTHGTGASCKPGMWTTVHWVGTLPDGRVVTDSRAEPGGLPKTFALGASEVFRCWDLAIPKLVQGDKATLHCPSYYSWGGAYTQAPLGGEPIPLNTDVNFDIEVVECNHTPTFTTYNEQPVTTTMQPDTCMWLHLEEAEHTGNDMVLTVQDGKTIVHHREYTDLNQQWSIDASGHLHPYSGAAGENMQRDGSISKSNDTTWWYDSENHTITTRAMTAYDDRANFQSNNKHLAVSKEKLMPGSETIVTMSNDANLLNSHWRIEYCEHWKA
jgi:hypothetical protein